MVTIRKINDGDSAEEADPRDARISTLETEIQGLAALVARALSGGAVAVAESQIEHEKKAPPLPAVEDERKRILAAWAAEERVTIMIAPDVNDQKAREAMQAQAKRAGQEPEGVGFPPRIFQVNGVQLAIPVGELHSVPRSIADMYAYQINPWKARGITPPVTFAQAEERMGISA